MGHGKASTGQGGASRARCHGNMDTSGSLQRYRGQREHAFLSHLSARVVHRIIAIGLAVGVGLLVALVEQMAIEGACLHRLRSYDLSAARPVNGCTGVDGRLQPHTYSITSTRSAGCARGSSALTPAASGQDAYGTHRSTFHRCNQRHGPSHVVPTASAADAHARRQNSSGCRAAAGVSGAPPKQPRWSTRTRRGRTLAA